MKKLLILAALAFLASPAHARESATELKQVHAKLEQLCQQSNGQDEKVCDSRDEIAWKLQSLGYCPTADLSGWQRCKHN